MYIDTRIKPEGRISGECWIPALIYDKRGFIAYAHYPKLVLEEDVDDTPGADTSPEGRRVLDQLIARAHWEAGDYEWVLKKAKEASASAAEN